MIILHNATKGQNSTVLGADGKATEFKAYLHAFNESLFKM